MQHRCGWSTGIFAQQALDHVAYLLSALLLALSRTPKPATTQGQGQPRNALDQRKRCVAVQTLIFDPKHVLDICLALFFPRTVDPTQLALYGAHIVAKMRICGGVQLSY